MNDNDARREDMARSLTPRPATPPSDKNLPLGDRLRNLIQPALDDTRRQAAQLEMVDQMFMAISQNLEAYLNRALGDFFNQAATVERRNADMKNLFILDKLTREAKENPSPIVRVGVPVNTAFIEFSAQDIKELPGYIALHEVAREMNVALKIMNITMDETKTPSGYPQQCVLVIDMTKSYEEGAMENASLYPQLPPKKVEFDRNGGQKFKF